VPVDGFARRISPVQAGRRYGRPLASAATASGHWRPRQWRAAHLIRRGIPGDPR